MAKASIIPDVRFLSGGQHRNLVSRLKYLEFREGSTRMVARRQGDVYRCQSWEDMTHIKEDDLPRTFDPQTGKRWVDRGLGDNYKTILRRCAELQGDEVLARTWVISPAPDLMAAVSEKRRLALLGEVTEAIVERFYEEEEWGHPDYTYVMHTRSTNARDQSGQPQTVQEQLHTHVITPGSHAGLSFGREAQPRFVRVERLHRLSREVWERALERELGKDLTRDLLAARERPESDAGHDLQSKEQSEIDLGVSFELDL